MTATTPTALAPYIPSNEDRGDLLWDPAAYAHAIGVATAISKSGLLPEHFKDKPASVLIALAMARRLREDPFVVLQSVHVIHGKPGFSAQYVIARANLSGRFRGPIRFTEAGAGATLAVTAYAELAESGERVEFEVSLQMAKDEGWTKSSKYQSMPKLMLRYRAATFLVRLYAPEVMLGMQTAEELRDVGGDEYVVNTATSVDSRPVTLTPDDPAPTEPPKGLAGVAAALGDDATTATPPTTTPSAPPKDEQQQSETTTATTDGAERAALTAELIELSKVLPDEVRERLKRVHNLRRLRADADIVKLRAFVDACRTEAEHHRPEPAPQPSATTETLETMLAAIMDYENSGLTDEQVLDAAKAAGMPIQDFGGGGQAPDVDQASAEQLQRYHDELRGRAG